MNMLFPSDGRTPSCSPRRVARPGWSGKMIRYCQDGVGYGAWPWSRTTVIDNAALAAAGLLFSAGRDLFPDRPTE
jgi:hypothetical protein